MYDNSYLKKANLQKLLSYGFVNKNDVYEYNKTILNSEFSLYVRLEQPYNVIKTKLIDNATDEEYTLHLMNDVQGEFVGKVKQTYDSIINDIKSKCFDMNVFEWEYSYKVLDYCFSKYGSDAEYLWEKFPRNAVCRRKDNKKWYLALLSLNGEKLVKGRNEIIEVIDLRVPSELINEIIDNKRIFPAYHMNKKHWITIILDGSVSVDEIFDRIDISYELAAKK